MKIENMIYQKENKDIICNNMGYSLWSEGVKDELIRKLMNDKKIGDSIYKFT
jgi:hypothetical protein